jgi:hypothetical protein
VTDEVEEELTAEGMMSVVPVVWVVAVFECSSLADDYSLHGDLEKKTSNFVSVV